MTATFSFFFFLKVMPLPHIIPRRGWKSCNALANHSNGVGGVHSKKTILLPRGSIPCNNGSNNLTQLSTPFKPKFKISSGSASTDLDTKKDSKLWKKVLKVIYYFKFHICLSPFLFMYSKTPNSALLVIQNLEHYLKILVHEVKMPFQQFSM